MRPIGGFFELELPCHGEAPHPRAHALSTGRACMVVMLRQLRPRLVHVPFYTCDAVLEPFRELGIATRYYAIDQRLFPCVQPTLGDGDFFLWINYFGVCRGHTEALKRHYAGRLLIDDTHNFFRQGHVGFWSFTSARKYFGVPDGAYLYPPVEVAVDAKPFEGISLLHSVLRTLGRQVEAFAAYQEYERSLDCSVSRISAVSEGLLRGIDLRSTAKARRTNFAYLHERLRARNLLSIDTSLDEVPFCYPYLPSKPVDRYALYADAMFVPSLWSDTLVRPNQGFLWERRLSAELLPLPIDHRYTPENLRRLADHLLTI
jgi:hypothetical protein